MKILHHDFGGYPYPAELSRALAARGHEVVHAWCASLATTPGGEFTRRSDDPPSLELVPLGLGRSVEKYSYVVRWRQERRYGEVAAELTRRVRPDVVISANMPLDAQSTLLRATHDCDAAFVFWLQDMIGIATRRLLAGTPLGLGGAVGRHYVRSEARMLRESDAVVPITDDFRPLLRAWGVEDDRITTIENWAPVGDLPVRPKDNPWARSHGYVEPFVFLYAGTMGMKHNPELLARLAESASDRPDARVVVLSEGRGAAYLAEQKRVRPLDNLIVQGFEPFDRMPDVMGAADVLVGILEPGAGAFSVPSKVLAYLCGARPLLLAMPEENLAGRIVRRERAGIVVSPHDADAFVAGGRELLERPELREELGARARRYAERAFPIGGIADRFEAVLERALAVRKAHAT